MAKLQNVVIKFVGSHTRHPEIVGASLVDALCGGCPLWWMSSVVDALCGGCPLWWMTSVVDVPYSDRQAQDLPLQLETIGGLGVE